MFNFILTTTEVMPSPTALDSVKSTFSTTSCLGATWFPSGANVVVNRILNEGGGAVLLPRPISFTASPQEVPFAVYCPARGGGSKGEAAVGEGSPAGSGAGEACFGSVHGSTETSGALYCPLPSALRFRFKTAVRRVIAAGSSLRDLYKALAIFWRRGMPWLRAGPTYTTFNLYYK